LRRRPEHFGALNNLGMLLYERGSPRAALRAYTMLCERHPDSAIAHAHLAKVLHDEGRAEEAVAHYRRALTLDPTASSAYHGLATILSERGDEEAAAQLRRLGYRHRPVTFGRYRGSGEPIRLLVLGVEGEGNVPTKALFDDRIFAVASLIVDFYDRNGPLPPHDVVFNAIGDADRCALALTAANEISAQTDAPVLNRPSAVLATGRVANAERLGRLPDVVTPRFGIFPRWLLERTDPAKALAASGFGWPVLLRSPGFHTGQHFVKVDEPSQLAAALAGLPGTSVIALAYLDTRSVDGSFRKYRVIAVDGRIYPLHLAISKDWKVHYFTADMEDNPAHRTEEAAFLAASEETIGSRAYAALESIVGALGLEYAGIDFAVDAQGRVVLFEANATMIVQPPPADARWDYRREPVERIVRAVQTMLIDRARQPTRAKR
jgi:glutathione synthase/RimK-type ligase-like ATP-grasp enzyme